MYFKSKIDIKRQISAFFSILKDIKFNKKWLGIIALLLCFGLYLGYLLFGNNSLEVLLKLQSKQRYLQEQAQIIEAQNAALQKQIFELRELKR